MFAFTVETNDWKTFFFQLNVKQWLNSDYGCEWAIIFQLRLTLDQIKNGYSVGNSSRVSLKSY